jgi:hypothetical protein
VRHALTSFLSLMQLRNKVYALLLHPVEYEIDNVGEEPFGFRRKPNASFANSAILRTSSQVHREAYDMMVKDNQLVLVRSTGNIPLRLILKGHSTPIITTD